MSYNKVEYKINQSSFDQINNHLQYMDEYFIPRLSSYIDIEAYALKLLSKAIKYEAWCDQELVGLIAGYLNVDVFFISNVSVYPIYQKQKTPYHLFSFAIDKLKLSGVKSIQLEVFSNNLKAIKFYKKNGFTKYEEKKQMLVMHLNLI